MHLTSDLSAVRSMAERCLPSQCERAPKTANCFLEKLLVQGKQRLEFIRVAPAIVITRLCRKLVRLEYLFRFLLDPHPPTKKYNYRNFEYFGT